MLENVPILMILSSILNLIKCKCLNLVNFIEMDIVFLEDRTLLFPLAKCHIVTYKASLTVAEVI